MAEAKPIASLSSTLLARKGHAKPAMRPQGYSSFGFGAPPSAEDLGWNDMGGDAPASPQPTTKVAEVVPITPETTPDRSQTFKAVEPPVVHRQQDEIAREMAAHVEPAERRRDDRARDAVTTVVERVVATRAAPGGKAKAAFTLRLEAERHLKLRLAGAIAHRSSQAIVIEALDAYLAALPRVTELAREAASRPGPADDTKTRDDTKTKDKR